MKAKNAISFSNINFLTPCNFFKMKHLFCALRYIDILLPSNINLYFTSFVAFYSASRLGLSIQVVIKLSSALVSLLAIWKFKLFSQWNFKMNSPTIYIRFIKSFPETNLVLTNFITYTYLFIDEPCQMPIHVSHL